MARPHDPTDDSAGDLTDGWAEDPAGGWAEADASVSALDDAPADALVRVTDEVFSVPASDQIDWAVQLLTDAGVPSPRHDVEALAAHVLGVAASSVRLALLRGDRLALDPAFGEAVARRAERVPLQHLTGTAPFRTLELAVGPGVFVPRPETELVAGAGVDAARRAVSSGRRPVVVDLCAGSAALALSVAAEVPSARVHAVELSAHAVAWAQRNIDALGLTVQLHQADVTDPAFPAAFLRSVIDLRPDPGAADLAAVDIVVSNPPYIPPGASPVDPEVRDHDPPMALYGGGPDGLLIPRAVVRVAARLLRPGGVLVLEHADVQQDAVLAMMTGSAWDAAVGHHDLTGRPRYAIARRAATSSLTGQPDHPRDV
ncbi:MAG: peptide chain release factor N(5)-glutamine methyltransferase [Angustibacter sp.]